MNCATGSEAGEEKNKVGRGEAGAERELEGGRGEVRCFVNVELASG